MAHQGGESISVVQQRPATQALTRFWRCPRCTLNSALSIYECPACGFQRARHHRHGGSGTEALAGMALRAALAGVAGLALGRASAYHGVRRMAVTALAVAAVPLANALLSRVLGQRLGGGSGGSSSSGDPSATSARQHPAAREQRRRQLRRAAQQAAGEAASAGAISADELRMLDMVMQPAESRTDRVRMIAGVLQWLRQVEADPAPRSRSTQLVSALVVHELNALVDEMSYEELYEAFGGHPPPKGLPQEQIDTLPAACLTAEGIEGLHSGSCVVCMEAFEPGETARVLPACRHAFHAACLDPWLQSKALCPICRTQVEPQAAPSCGAGPGAQGAASKSE